MRFSEYAETVARHNDDGTAAPLVAYHWNVAKRCLTAASERPSTQSMRRFALINGFVRSQPPELPVHVCLSELMDLVAAQADLVGRRLFIEADEGQVDLVEESKRVWELCELPGSATKIVDIGSTAGSVWVGDRCLWDDLGRKVLDSESSFLVVGMLGAAESSVFADECARATNIGTITDRAGRLLAAYRE